MNIKQLNEELFCLLEDLNDIRQKYYSDIPDNIFRKILHIDPTYNKDSMPSYGKWLLNMYRKNKEVLNNHEKLFDALQFYNKNKREFNSADILKYKTIEDLINEYNNLKGTISLSDRQKRKAIHKIDINASENIDKIYEDNEWVLYVPKTYQTSVKLGRNTEWCTASSNNYYFNYYSKEGPLVVCFNKNTGEKYQYHKESRQFKNATDLEENKDVLSEQVWNYLRSKEFSDYENKYRIWRKEHRPLAPYKDILYDSAIDWIEANIEDLLDRNLDSVWLEDVALRYDYTVRWINHDNYGLFINVKNRPDITNEKVQECISYFGYEFIQDSIDMLVDDLSENYDLFTISGNSGGYWGLQKLQNNLNLTDGAYNKLANTIVDIIINESPAEEIDRVEWYDFLADNFDFLADSIESDDIIIDKHYLKQLQEISDAVDRQEEYMNTDEYIEDVFDKEQLEEMQLSVSV